MRKLFAIAIMFLFFLSAIPAFAQISTRKGTTPSPRPSQKAYEQASEKSAFNRAGDWFATIGKSSEEKEKIIAERDARRAVKQAEAKAGRLQKQAEGKAKGLQQKDQQQVRQKTQEKTQKQAAKPGVAAGRAVKK
jgi:hypothetical protein